MRKTNSIQRRSRFLAATGPQTSDHHAEHSVCFGEPLRGMVLEETQGATRTAVPPTARSERKPPKLRRAFPIQEPEWEAWVRERNRAALSDDPRSAELENRLLELGGTVAILFQPDYHVSELLTQGRYFPGAGALFCRGRMSACHENVSMLYLLTNGQIRIATGYALSPDGLWRRHSWGVTDIDGHVIETTVRRLRYFGFVVSDTEAIPFILGNIRFLELVEVAGAHILHLIINLCHRSPETTHVLNTFFPGFDLSADEMQR
jgi:hypothetical protein